MTLARQLAEFVNDAKAIPASTRAMAVSTVFDLIIAAIVGVGSPGGRAALQAARASWGEGAAQCWFSSTRLSAPGAAFANSAIASMLDLDDGHRAAAGHPGASVIPAVLATVQAGDADAERILVAIALGYEIGVRISASRELSTLDTLASGPWCGQGAAAAAAWLRGLSAPEIAEAIAIAGTSAPNLKAAAYSRVMGNHVKEGIPWATATGMAAVELAASGFTGPLDLFDNGDLYDAARLTRGLGEAWLIDDIYFKPYSCCRWAHAAIDAVLELQAGGGVSAGAIEAIDIHTFARALQLNNDVDPITLEAAQYSIPFCVALAALRGADALLPLRQESLGDPVVVALARRVRLRVDPSFDRMFSAAVPARVEIATPAGCFVHTVMAPKGEATNPMTWPALKTKFDTATRRLVSESFAACLLEAFEALRDGDITLLRATLASPLAQTSSLQIAGVAAHGA